MSEKNTIRRYQLDLLGILYLMVTPLAVLPGIPFGCRNPDNWWHSVSQSYYANTGIIMIGFFFMIGILSITFRCRLCAEKIAMLVKGFSCLGILAFPHAYENPGCTGFFYSSCETSIMVHFIFAGIFFVALNFHTFLMCLLPEERNFLRKRVFHIGSCVIISICSIIIACVKKGFLPGYTVLFMEFIIFSLYGINLLVCAGLFFPSCKE